MSVFIQFLLPPRGQKVNATSLFLIQIIILYLYNPNIVILVLNPNQLPDESGLRHAVRISEPRLLVAWLLLISE